MPNYKKPFQTNTITHPWVLSLLTHNQQHSLWVAAGWRVRPLKIFIATDLVLQSSFICRHVGSLLVFGFLAAPALPVRRTSCWISHTHMSEASLFLTNRSCPDVGCRSVTPQLMSNSIDLLSYFYIYCLFVCSCLRLTPHADTHTHSRIIAICSPARQSQLIIVKALVKTLPDSIDVSLLAGA